MAEEIITTAPEAGAGSDTPASQVADPTSQEAGQGQDSGQGSQGVDNQAPSASSTGTQERKSNAGWAQQRVLEKKLERMLSDRLNPILERLDRFQAPPGSQSAPGQEKLEIDYNDLPGSINRLVERGIHERLNKFEKEKLTGLDTKMDEKLKLREARNYLMSQPEIGDNEEKLEEIRQIMKDEMLDYAAIYDPAGATKKAVKIWMQRRKNPSAPPSSTLSTVTGGTVRQAGSKQASVEELKNLQKIVMSDAPEDEKAKAYARIDELARV